MTSDDIIRESLIARIEQLTGQVSEMEKRLDKAHGAIWDLSVGVNNLLALGNETQRARYGRLLEVAKEFRR